MEVRKVSAWVLVVNEGHNDYYAGDKAALYKDGQRVWFGYSNDEAEALVRAIVGDDLEVRTVWVGADLPELLDEMPPSERP